MADYVRTERVTRQVRYELPSPTSMAEFSKATGAAGASFRSMRGREATWDDDLHVVAEDDVIVIWFEVPDGR